MKHMALTLATKHVDAAKKKGLSKNDMSSQNLDFRLRVPPWDTSMVAQVPMVG